MEQVGLSEAKARWMELLDRVEQGESILITRNGRPAALLCPPHRTTAGQSIGKRQEGDSNTR
jgi:prevent-host-death family protein